MVVADASREGVSLDADLANARGALAQEWAAASPVTAGDVANFYRTSTRLADDLDAWHKLPERQDWTRIVLHVARQVIHAKNILDIGAGAGYELQALRDGCDADVALMGVEPNLQLRHRIRAAGLPCVADIADVDVAAADLLLCLDVLEHVPDPESFLAGIAQQAHPNAVLIESTATHDTGTPLHLAANRGWHPGHCLETYGWDLLDERNRVRVWQRVRPGVVPTASVLLCAYRACSIPTMMATLELQKAGFRLRVKHSDGLISRARAIVSSEWYRQTADDVFLMIDDDIVFESYLAEKLVDECRNGHDIIHAAYPVRDGGHIALRGTDMPVAFGPDQPVQEIRWAATGFLAVHRRVFDALVSTVPLCMAATVSPFWPLWQPFWVEDEAAGGWNYLSEDWAFCERARQAGFKVWVDASIKLGHLANIQVSVDNMDAISDALKGGEL